MLEIYKLKLYDNEGELVFEDYFETENKAKFNLKKIEKEINSKIEDYEIEKIRVK